jgi:hypothetical protein
MPFALPDGAQLRIGGMLCEDMWTEDVAEGLEESGAEILIVPNGSPYEHDKPDVRLNLAVARGSETGLPLNYSTPLGGQHDLVIDGATIVLNPARRPAAQATAFVQQLLITRRHRAADPRWTCAAGEIAPPAEGLEAIYQAMCLGLRDYVDKNRFPGVVLGLSGGIDSALSAAVAVDALGPERVHAVMMPSRYTSDASTEDAEAPRWPRRPRATPSGNRSPSQFRRSSASRRTGCAAAPPTRAAETACPSAPTANRTGTAARRSTPAIDRSPPAAARPPAASSVSA